MCICNSTSYYNLMSAQCQRRLINLKSTMVIDLPNIYDSNYRQCHLVNSAALQMASIESIFTYLPSGEYQCNRCYFSQLAQPEIISQSDYCQVSTSSMFGIFLWQRRHLVSISEHCTKYRYKIIFIWKYVFLFFLNDFQVVLHYCKLCRKLFLIWCFLNVMLL